MALELLPQFRKVAVKQRARDYLVDGARYQRVTTALGIINKPALIGWAKGVTLNAVEAILRNPETVSNLELVTSEGSKEEYSSWVERLIRAARDDSNKKRNEAADLGTQAHGWIESHLKHPDDEVRKQVPDELLPAFDGALRFLADYQIELIATEQVVWDSDLQIAGTFDGAGYRTTKCIGCLGSGVVECQCVFDSTPHDVDKCPDCQGTGEARKLVIFDWKRSKGIYWEYALQLGAYAHCLTNVSGLVPAEAFAVRLPRIGDDFEYEVKQVANIAAATTAYLDTLALHRASKIDWWEDSPS